MLRPRGWTTFLPIRFRPAILPRGLPEWQDLHRSLRRPGSTLPKVNPMLQTDLVPHFTVTTFSGESFDYSDIWQRKNLVLVLLPAESTASTKFIDQHTAKTSELTGDDSACVITRDRVSGVPSPGIVVADRWGEIHHVADGNTVDDLPGPDDVIEWLRYVQHQCPECEGEAK